MKHLQFCIARTLLILFLIVASDSCLAGPPFITDDPEPVEPHKWEIAYAVNIEKSQGSTVLGFPSVDINYGLMSDMQIHAQPRLTYLKGDAQHHYGVDDLELGVKYRFVNYHDQNTTWMAGIYPMVLLPMADKTLHPGKRKIQTYWPIWLQHNSKNWTVYGGGGYRINEGTNAKNSWFTGITVLNQITENLQLGGEIFHESAVSDSEHATGGFSLGGKYDLSDKYHLLFSTGKGYINVRNSNEFSVYMALQETF